MTRTLSKKLFWVAFALLFAHQFVMMVKHLGWSSIGQDADVYWAAGAGEIEYLYIPEAGTRQRELYDRQTPEFKQALAYHYGEKWRAVFSVASVVPRMVWRVSVTLVCVVLYVLLIAKVVDEVQYGWGIALLVTRYAENLVLGGNLGAPMALALIHPVGMVMAGALKLHLAGVAVVCAGLWIHDKGKKSRDSRRHVPVPAPCAAAVATGQGRLAVHLRDLVWAARLEFPGIPQGDRDSILTERRVRR